MKSSDVKPDDVVDVLVMVYPGAVQLRLDGRVRHVTEHYIDVELGGYVLHVPKSEIHDWGEQMEIVAGSQHKAWPVEHYRVVP